ncbi:acyl-CoA thioesterase [Domibacillus sp. DTU_2020_1001157_1_SI_ALB_TIR_016]|uniref:acyl-CoA thioesterase n=1 Tax=Domibacillus sp. DTU_2020_1001157_1_SI_ALB_TIR_016 TaxID=3077789 RepID=UPI0028E877A2|nr:acyl-CoA thioesterase [Domibacillus sp. DTU_2020_1001157_1_SI_ALB_TIR_016]WNS80175.1 acyl-CoA thioesterase [Domibacillus sp. DTU_2020_1001157_1_SI_ALB_TIR_016]
MRKRTRMQDTITVKSAQVFPPDTNYYGTLFGGKLMAHIDDVASISATRFARNPTVTASTDSVDFIRPIKVGDTVTLMAMVTYTGRSSMEVFVRVTSENLITGDKEVAALSFLTFVAIDQNGKPVEVGEVIPETEEEKWLFETAPARAAHRKSRKDHSKELAAFFKKV